MTEKVETVVCVLAGPIALMVAVVVLTPPVRGIAGIIWRLIVGR